MKIVKTIISVLVVLVLAALTIACGIGSAVDGHWFQNPNVETWFHSWGKEEESEENIAILAYAIAVDEYEDYGINPQEVTNAKSLSIDFTPTNTSDKRINWHVRFKNENSEWARGKNPLDYVEFVAAPNYGSTATIGEKEPFGETIIIEACSRSNPNLKATINVERCAYVSNFHNDECYSITLDEWNNKTPIDYLGGTAFWTVDDDCDVFTVIPDEFRGTVSFDQYSLLLQYVKDSDHDEGEGYIPEVDIKYFTNWHDFLSGFNSEQGWMDLIYVADSKVSTYCIEHGLLLGTLHYDLTYYYHGEEMGNFRGNLDVELTDEFVNAFAIPATALTPNTDTIVF